MLDDVVTESIGENLAWQGWYGNSCTLSFQDITEVLEVRISAPDGAVLEFEGGDVCSADNLVVCVHTSGRPVCLRILHLYSAF